MIRTATKIDPETPEAPTEEPQPAHESRAGQVGQATTLPQEPDAPGDGHHEPPRPPQPPTPGRGGPGGGRKHRPLPSWAKILIIFAVNLLALGIAYQLGEAGRRLIYNLEHPRG